MAFSKSNQRQIDSFFAAIEPVSSAYAHKVFSYLAVRSADSFVLCDGRIFLNIYPPKEKQRAKFSSENVRAGRFNIDDMGMGLKEFLQSLSDGSIETEDGPLLFAPNDAGGHDAFFEPYNQEGLRNQSRYNLLTISGAYRDPYLKQPNLDWELKAAAEPFDTIQELQFEFNLGQPPTDRTRIEVVGFNTAVVSAEHSSVSDSKAHPVILVALGIPETEVTLGYRVVTQENVIDRASVNGSEMSWTEHEGMRMGELEFEIPSGAVVHTIVSCGGIAQHHYWLADPENFPNPRRSTLGVFDKDFETLLDFLSRSGGRGHDARDFEAGVSWLLWMLGFSTAHMGGTKRMQDAADIIAITSSNRIAVVECTTGLLRTENKLPLLIARAEAVQSKLAKSGSGHLSVLPVMITSKSKAEIKADLEHAENLGVLVLTKENLENMWERTLIQHDADVLFDQALDEVISKKKM